MHPSQPPHPAGRRAGGPPVFGFGVVPTFRRPAVATTDRPIRRMRGRQKPRRREPRLLTAPHPSICFNTRGLSCSFPVQRLDCGLGARTRDLLFARILNDWQSRGGPIWSCDTIAKLPKFNFESFRKVLTCYRAWHRVDRETSGWFATQSRGERMPNRSVLLCRSNAAGWCSAVTAGGRGRTPWFLARVDVELCARIR